MIYIRTDMNSIVATGHMMRCLSIADAVRSRGEDVTFLLADDNGIKTLEARGYPYFILNSVWNDLESELPVLVSFIESRGVKKLLIDHYSVTPKYLSALHEYVYTAYIDDLNAFFYPVDLLICYANYYEKFCYRKRYRDNPIRTGFCLGTGYVPLRSAFWNCGKKEIHEEIRSLLIMSGGSDPFRFISQLLERLDILSYKKIYVICGLYNFDYEMLKERYASFSHVEIVKAVSDIDKYMKQADLAISAAGSALYELCAVGTPAISYTFADNQMDNAVQFDKDGIIPYSGDIRKKDVIHSVLEMLENGMTKKYRMQVSEKMQHLVDGRGAARIADIILQNTEV